MIKESSVHDLMREVAPEKRFLRFCQLQEFWVVLQHEIALEFSQSKGENG